MVALIICLSPCFLELYSTGRKYIFISQMIQKEKLIFLVYSEIIFLMYIGFWAVIFGSTASLFKLLLGKK
jgi:hypothetical protein